MGLNFFKYYTKAEDFLHRITRIQCFKTTIGLVPVESMSEIWVC
jgi:hypothetical protein